MAKKIIFVCLSLFAVDLFAGKLHDLAVKGDWASFQGAIGQIKEDSVADEAREALEIFKEARKTKPDFLPQLVAWASTNQALLNHLLGRAVFYKEGKLATMFLDAKADINAKFPSSDLRLDKREVSVLDLSVKGGHSEITSALLQIGATGVDNALAWAAQLNAGANAAVLLEGTSSGVKANPDANFDTDSQPLVIACRARPESVVKELLKAGAKLPTKFELRVDVLGFLTELYPLVKKEPLFTQPVTGMDVDDYLL